VLKENKLARLAAPKHLAETERQLWTELIRTYRLDDAASCELLCQALEARQRAREAREAVKAEGATFTDKRGIVRAHPLLAVERAANASFLGAMRLLRLDLGAGEGK
jgi:phage terminase small subunit